VSPASADPPALAPHSLRERDLARCSQRRPQRRWLAPSHSRYNARFDAAGVGSRLLQEGDCVATKSVVTRSVAGKGIGGKTAAAKTVAAKSPAKKGKELKDLSEEDLLKAPDKEYMNEAQLAFFKQRLLELRAQLLNNADDTGQHLRENEVTTDPSDRATLEEEYTLELRTRDRERKLLKKVEKSLKMIDAGSYGYCEETGEPIGVPRLLARPTATLSLEAQERRERVQKLYGD
jgi:DnaK suppressor protein